MDHAEITSLIVACAKAHRSALNDKLRALGLFIGQDILLVHVADAGSASQRALATALRVEEATVSESVKKLARAGLVERLPDKADRRAYRIVVTEEGAAIADKVRKVWAEYEAKAIEPLEDAQIGVLKTALEKILARIT